MQRIVLRSKTVWGRGRRVSWHRAWHLGPWEGREKRTKAKAYFIKGVTVRSRPNEIVCHSLVTTTENIDMIMTHHVIKLKNNTCSIQ